MGNMPSKKNNRKEKLNQNTKKENDWLASADVCLLLHFRFRHIHTQTIFFENFQFLHQHIFHTTERTM